MSEAFTGEIRLFGFSFAPVNWALCSGQLMPISQNTALFSLLGTNYGGNGTTNYALPNFGGNIPIGTGQSTAGSQYSLGELVGAANVVIDNSSMPAHTHTFSGASFRTEAEGPTPGPTASYANAAGCKPFLPSNTSPAPTMVAMSTQAISPGGGNSLPHNNLMPYLGTNFCICTLGIFPSRP